MSPIPDAVDRLVAVLPGALEIDVYDGPPIVNFEQDGLSVGYVNDELAITSRETDTSLNTRGEIFDVHCFMWARTGDEEVKLVRDRIFGYLDTIKATIKTDPTLGGAVTRAQVRFTDFDQGQTSEGAWAVVIFAVHCAAI
ncbi:hypothetical protein BAY59_10765 [Prauserella coralliicola]|nr:hypothetical protein BAY59_10765 [Prauserella coralliicola]